MEFDDTQKLLRECDAGIEMGVASIGDVLDYVKNPELKKILCSYKTEHEELNIKIKELLSRYGDDGKEPNPIAKSMSWFKTNIKLGVNESDTTVANLITDGCDMGIKSLNKYLNQYKAANKTAKDIAEKLIVLEERLRDDMQAYL